MVFGAFLVRLPGDVDGPAGAGEVAGVEAEGDVLVDGIDDRGDEVVRLDCAVR